MNWKSVASLLMTCLILAMVQADGAKASPDLLTLKEAYRLALQQSESVGIAQQDINRAQARFYRAWNLATPQVNFLMTRFEQDVAEGSTSEDGVTGDSRRRVKPESKFTFSQPIFSGFKELAALLSTGADKKAQRFKYQHAKELLFLDVIDSFYAVLQNEKDLETLETIHKLMTDRIQDLRARVELGRSRNSEQQTALADLKIVESELALAKVSLKNSRNLLEFYIGRELSGQTLSDEDVSGEGVALKDYLARARTRSDVQAAEQTAIVSEKSIISAQAGFIPKVSVDGNYYTKRVGFQDGNDWDVTLKLDVPVFDLPDTAADIKQAVAQRDEDRLKFRQAHRLAELDIKNAFEDYESSVLVEKALADAAAASKENYGILNKEYSTNLVNNLDVLDSLRRYQDTLRSHTNAHFSAKRNFWRLKAFSGELP